MSKIAKLAGIIIVIIALLIVTVAILLATLINPNRLKPMLTDQVKKYTGRELIVDGDLSWTFFPYLGVKVGHMSLSNPADFTEKTFAEFNQATIGVKLLPLLHQQIESSGIVLNGMRLHLIKRADGKVNWIFPHKATTGTSGGSTQSTTSKKAIMGFTILGIDVSDASITYADNLAKKSYAIDQFELHAKNISLTGSFPIKTSFHFSATNPALSGQVMISSDVVADLNRQTLDLINLKAKLANINMVGKVNVQHMTTEPQVTGHVQLQPFDLKETLKTLGQQTDNLQIAKTVTGDADFSSGANATEVKANLRIDTLQAAKVMMTNVNMKAHFQNGVLNLAPITANLYQGSLHAEAKANFNAAIPQMTLNGNLINVESQPLMEDLGGANQKIKIAGLGNLELQLTTSGSDSKAIVQNLNGLTHFSFHNGAIIGIDLGYLVDTAAGYARGQSPSATNTGQTNFGTLTGTATIKNGIMTNNDLFSDAPRFATRGSGTINLVNQTIDYTLQTTVKSQSNQDNNLKNLYGISIPVTITGSLEKPNIRLDTGSIVKSAAKQKITDEIKKRLPGEADKLLKGKAGDVLNNLLGN